MTSREVFIKKIEELLNNNPNLFGNDEESKQAIKYFNSMVEGKTTGNMTEKGQKILTFMQENKEKFNNQFKSSDIAEGIDLSARSVGSSVRKLITDGYVERISDKPVIYALTN